MSVGLFELALERRRAIQSRILDHRHEFEMRGVAFVEGFLAGDQGNAPRWFLKLRREVRSFLGTKLAVEAGHQYLADAGLDAIACGQTFHHGRSSKVHQR